MIFFFFRNRYNQSWNLVKSGWTQNFSKTQIIFWRQKSRKETLLWRHNWPDPKIRFVIKIIFVTTQVSEWYNNFFDVPPFRLPVVSIFSFLPFPSRRDGNRTHDLLIVFLFSIHRHNLYPKILVVGFIAEWDPKFSDHFEYFSSWHLRKKWQKGHYLYFTQVFNEVK